MLSFEENAKHITENILKAFVATVKLNILIAISVVFHRQKTITYLKKRKVIYYK